MKPYYEHGGITIYHGDCLDVMDREAIFAEATLTDPPYNAGKNYGAHDDSMLPERYEEWCGEWWSVIRAISKRIIVFPGHGNLPMWFRIAKPSAVGCWYKPGN